MKFAKYLVVLTIVLCAFASNSNAQTIKFLGGGSSAIALELGQAAATSAATATPCVWTYGSDPSIAARDNRPPSPSTYDAHGQIWITWSQGAGADCNHPANPGVNIYSYMNLDSVIGDRCYFINDGTGTGCVQIITIGANTTGQNKLPGITDSTGGIPALIISALNNQHYFAIGTDVRPEDAKFASLRMFTPCGQPVWRQFFDQGERETYGLGYQTATTGVGTSVLSSFDTSSFPVLDFNITGNDPITGLPVPSYSVSAVGAQPMIIAVSPAGGTGIGAATDINMFTLSMFQQGVLGRSTDLFGPTSANVVDTLIREPLSGTYNTTEFSVANTSQFHGSQDDNNCSGANFYANPMTLQSTNGAVLAARRRVIGTGQMVKQLQLATFGDTLGYFFWSSANASGLTNVKYLTVNGVDPIKNAYTDGVLPGIDAGHPISDVTFKWLNQGDYPIWSPVRIVSQSPAPAGVSTLITAAQSAPLTATDMIPLANLKVWHSHFALPTLNINYSANGTTVNPATPGDLCNSAGALAEYGGDAGGATIAKQANADFCTDYGNITGLINKTN